MLTDTVSFSRTMDPMYIAHHLPFFSTAVTLCVCVELYRDVYRDSGLLCDTVAASKYVGFLCTSVMTTQLK